jgi:hypothetical protein
MNALRENERTGGKRQRGIATGAIINKVLTGSREITGYKNRTTVQRVPPQ